MKRLSAIFNDQILKYLALGIISPIAVALGVIGLAFLGITTDLFGDLFIYLLYIFTASLAGLVIYLPFYKKTATPKTKEAKILIFDWLLLSASILILLAKLDSQYLSSAFSGDMESLTAIVLITSGILFLTGIPFLTIYWIVKNNLHRSKIVATSITSAIIVSMIVAGGVYFFKPLKSTVAVYPLDTKGKTEFSCSTKIGATMFPQINYEEHTLEKIDGELLTDDETKMAIKVEGKELSMITAQSVEIGQTEPARLLIIRNDNEQISAVDTEEDAIIDQGLMTFILNKKTGLAVWTKSNPNMFMTEGIPHVQAYYLECL